jgi:DNA polymerase-4
LALKVKRALREQVGECLTCSIGLAPNVFLGKVGSDLQKPDGLVVITHDNLPGVLLGLELQDTYGIGKRMEERLRRAGIGTVAELWAASPLRLRRVWGRHQRVAVPPDAARRRHPASLLPLCQEHGPSACARAGTPHQSRRAKLLAAPPHQSDRTAAARRLLCRRLGLHLSWIGDLSGFWDEISFNETRDTGFLLARLEQLWPHVPRYKPLSIGVVLLDVVPASHHQPDLFAADTDRREKLSPLVDRINDRYGRCSIGFGLFRADVRAFTGHAAFHRVPESWKF